ncbi:unnamed protein product [Symbiodinium sp. KB8]|nr:unnamed protein product [Symbiodinium sp. KB8]
MPHGRPDLPGIFAQHQNASERRSSCKKPTGSPLASLVGGNISDASEQKAKKVEGVFHIFPGKKCRGSPFTVDRDASCDGFTGLSVEQCQKKCADSAKAPNCPQKTCGGAVSFESGWCHLWEECSESELVDSSPATAIIPKAGCPRGEVKLFDFQPAGATQSCCKQACAGCAYFSGNACQRCAGGFILREGQCTACTSSGGWLSVDGKSCMQLAAGDCSDEKVRGQSSNEACCQCGGGVVTPTPFSYPNSRWSLDSNIVLKPEPRTALRYTVDSKCELAAHNLTMDSSTGEISYMAGRAKNQAIPKPFMPQETGQTPASSVTLLFHDDSEEKLPLTTGSGWSKFELGCAPEVSWLSIVASTGALRYAAPSGATGGVSVADDILFGQDGAVCVVTAWQTHKKHQTTFVAIRPRPWPTLQYDLDAVAVSVGEDLHPLNPRPHKEQGLMKPWAFSMACDVSGAASSTRFTYDRILNMGLLDGHPILDISPDGAITVAPARTLSELFDALSVSGSQRKVETTLTIVVQDTVCWVPQNIKGTGLPHASADTEAKCRSQCRADETCANYKFEGQCMRYDARSDGNPVTVVAKVTNCTNEGTCMKVTHSEWYLAGTYCPLGRDAVLGGIVYLREHVTQQDMVYLREGSSGGCGANEWALMAPSSADFIDKALGLFELRGTRHACISSSSLEHSLSWCATKALAWIEEQEEDEEGQPALVLDDPGTAQPADFWLHPCDCAPDAWGADLPVDAQMYEQLPVAWRGVGHGAILLWVRD